MLATVRDARRSADVGARLRAITGQGPEITGPSAPKHGTVAAASRVSHPSRVGRA